MRTSKEDTQGQFDMTTLDMKRLMDEWIAAAAAAAADRSV